MQKRNVTRNEWIITLIIKISGYSSILFVTLIFIFLMREGLPALGDVPLPACSATRWYPIESYFGLWPLLLGSLLITISAVLIAVPFGVAPASSWPRSPRPG